MPDDTNFAQRVEARRHGRENAKYCIDMIGGIIDDSTYSEDKEFQRTFWQVFWGAFEKKLNQYRVQESKQFNPMTDDESSIFGQKIMPFGKFKGMKIDQIDKGYLEWFVNQPDDFKQDIQRYLTSDRVKREQ